MKKPGSLKGVGVFFDGLEKLPLLPNLSVRLKF